MGPFTKLFIAVSILGVCLYVGVRYFHGGSENLASKIDIRSLSYLRENDSEASTQQNTGDNSGQEVTVDQGEAQADHAAESYTAETTDDARSPEANFELAQEQRLVQTGLRDSKNAPIKLSAEERKDARDAKLSRLGLLPKKRPPPTIALDVSLSMPDSCKSELSLPQSKVPLEFRFDSPTLRGDSLNRLEGLVAVYRECAGGLFTLTENPLGKVDASKSLTQMRLDEVKYFFLQHSIPKSAIEFPEAS